MALKVLSVVGSRPSYMKVAAICEAINEYNWRAGSREIKHVLVHTGQHCNTNLPHFLFNDLDLPKADLFLGIGSGSQTDQIAKVMEGFEAVLLAEKPNIVLVAGDTNASVACALVTKKTWCSSGPEGTDFIPKLARLEAGLRSFDRTMPEEINRVVTDSISDYLLTTEESANQHLKREGVPVYRIHCVGSVIIDTLLRHLTRARESTILNDLQLTGSLQVKQYAVLTLRHPANVDDPCVLAGMFKAFLEISHQAPIIFPAHAHTLERIQAEDLGDYFVDHFMDGPELWDSRVRIRLVPPLGYLDFVQLMAHAKCVMTDSDAVQEETAALGVPCITLRDATERPVTLRNGTNVLTGADPKKIVTEAFRVLRADRQTQVAPKFWDGKAAERIVQILAEDRGMSSALEMPWSSVAAAGGDTFLNFPR